MKFCRSCLILLLLVFVCFTSSSFADKRYGGTVTVMVRETDINVRNFNPMNVEVGYYQAREWIYEPLYIFNVMNPDNNYPWLATKYEISEDLKSVSFVLRKEIKWSDGETFDADDVIFTVNLKKKHPELFMPPFWDTKDSEGLIGSVEKVDQYKVRFNLKKPNSLAYLTIGKLVPLPEHIWKDIKDPNNFTNPNPVATGPFTVIKEFKPTVFTLGKNPNYWQKGKPYVDAVRFPQFGSNEQVLAAAVKGKVDWIGSGLTDPKKSLTDKNKHMKYWFPAGGNANLQLNTTKKPFNNYDFREALCVAINRKDILEIATFGLTIESIYPNGIGEFYKTWYDHKRMQKYKYLMDYNPKLSREILDKAGFVDKDGDGWRDNPDGSKIKFKLSVPSGWTDWVNTMQVISENLQDVGINAVLHTPDEGAWFDAVALGDFDVYIMWVNISTTPYDTYEQMFNPAYMQTGGLTTQVMHQMRIPEIMDHLEAFTQTTDITKQKDLCGKVQEEVAKNLPVISLFSNPAWYEYNTERFEGWASEENPFIRPAVHGGYEERLVHILNISLKKGAK